MRLGAWYNQHRHFIALLFCFRLLMYSFARDHFMVPHYPPVKGNPCLDDFLRVSPHKQRWDTVLYRIPQTMYHNTIHEVPLYHKQSTIIPQTMFSYTTLINHYTTKYHYTTNKVPLYHKQSTVIPLTKYCYTTNKVLLYH